jgi:transposase
MSVSLCLRLRIPREPWAFVFALALPAISKATVGPGALFNRCSVIRVLSRGYKRDLSGSQATHPAPLPCSETPAESVILALPDFPMLPPVPTRRRLQRAHDFEANTRLRYPLSTLHERRCRHPCKTCFRLAGSAFAGRASNPLGHKERFQATSILLSRAYPDASWAHARRKFFELADIAANARRGKKAAAISPIALEAVKRIDALFDIERGLNGQSAEQRLRVRKEQSAPLVAGLEAWLREQRSRLSRASSVTEPIDYMLRRWGRFARFIDDGRICLTNNAAERALRGFALGRKSWLFAGSERGADRAAVMATLIVTAKLNDVDPQAWLADVLARIADHTIQNLDQLLPWNWKPNAAKLAA